MSDNIRAANIMQHAADDMMQAARNFEDSIQRHQQYMDVFLYNLEKIIDKGIAVKFPSEE